MHPVNACIQDCYCYAATADWQPLVCIGEFSIAAYAVDTGQTSRRWRQVPLKRPVTVERTHRRQVRDRHNPAPGRSHRDHWQRVVTRPSQDPDSLQIRDVSISRQMVIDDYGVDVAVVRQAIEQDGELRIYPL